MPKYVPLEPKPRPSVKGVPPEHFDPQGASNEFHAVLTNYSGAERKEFVILRLVTGHNSEQRQIIRNTYKARFHADLAKELKKHFHGHFSRAIYGLMLHPREFLAQQVHRAIKGLGTDEKKLTRLLCYRTDKELVEMKLFYREKYGKEMEDAVADDLSGDIKTLIVSMMNANRSEWSGIDEELIQADGQALYEVRHADLGAREELYCIIFTSRSPLHMRQVFGVYDQLSSGKTRIEDTINAAFTGSLRKAYLAMIKSFRNFVGYNAERLYKSMAGPGTDDETLMEILIYRSDIDLQDISEFYEARYKKRLRDAVSSETSGYYRTALTNLLENKNIQMGAMALAQTIKISREAWEAGDSKTQK